jgi:drug/metabolite transporter (DMT)-like permease
VLGPLLIVVCASLWATDAIFRLPLAGRLDASTIVLLEHAICVAVTLPWFLKRRREIKGLGPRGWTAVAFIGVMGSALGTIFFTASYRYLNPSITILLQKLQPLFAVAGARLFLGEKPRASFYPWATLALFAATLVSAPELFTGQPFSSPGSAREVGIPLAIGAAFSWGMSTVFGKWATRSLSFPVTTFLRFAWGLAALAAVAAVKAAEFHVPSVSAADLLPIVYMSLVPGVLAMYLYYAGLKRTRASTATFAEMFFPVAAVLINWRVLGAGLAGTQVAGMGLLLVAVYFITRGKR